MPVGTQSGERSVAVEIEAQGPDGGGGDRSFPVPVGAEARIIQHTPVGIGADNYDVKVVGDSLEYRGLVDVRREGTGPQPIGSARTDVVLVAKSVGNSAVEIRAMKGGKEIGVQFVSVDVVQE